MSIAQVLDLLCCPLCSGAFREADRSVRCPAGHSFDLAKHGQLNLLGRAAPPHADTAEMIAARGRFLSAGHFDPITAAVAASVPVADADVLEVGSGTGHHLARVVEVSGRGVALDISPSAARQAAAHDRIGAVVADVWRTLPLQDGGFDAVLAIFAPRNPAEFARVLRTGGVLVVVTPLPEHLIELRLPLGLLDIEAGKDDRLAAAMAGHLEPGPRSVCRYQVLLDTRATLDLVSMGPNAFHHDRSSLATQIATIEPPIAVSVAVTVSVWLRP
ncbi:MAG TPA: methyltransferase domain-containing protein [Propionibacteriaceae bacterium]